MAIYKILVIGGDSKIGQSVSAILKNSGCEVITTTRRKYPISSHTRYLDLSKPLTRWEPPKVDACLLAGAVTSLHSCREHPEYCEQVNVAGTMHVAEKLRTQGTYILFLSSNQVFDGSISHTQDSNPVNPLTQYGKHKADVESALRHWDNASGILRLSKVLDPDNGLLKSWRSNLSVGHRIQAYDDYFMAPISLKYASEVIAWMLQNRLPGITQLSGDIDLSYYDTALLLASAMEKAHLVDRVSAKQPSLVEHNPLHTTLDCSRLKKLYKHSIPSSLDTITHIVKALLGGRTRALPLPQSSM